MAREYILAFGSLESAETFISGAKGGALSFPGFNGESADPNMGQKEALFTLLMYLWGSVYRGEGGALLVLTFS